MCIATLTLNKCVFFRKVCTGHVNLHVLDFVAKSKCADSITYGLGKTGTGPGYLLLVFQIPCLFHFLNKAAQEKNMLIFLTVVFSKSHP